MHFADRHHAGKLLARALISYKAANPVVLALPRGGVEVGYEVARLLEAPLDIIIARKVGAPAEPELALGAVVDGDHPELVLNEEVCRLFNISRDFLSRITQAELKEIHRRQKVYRRGHPPVPIDNSTVILVDDGIATGASIKAAIRGLRRRPIDKLVLAVPVAPPSTLSELRPLVDDIVCLMAPEDFGAVGAFYGNFDQTTDLTVIELLDQARRTSPATAGNAHP
jgi:putative phosphoribosyl transferase